MISFVPDVVTGPAGVAAGTGWEHDPDFVEVRVVVTVVDAYVHY